MKRGKADDPEPDPNDKSFKASYYFMLNLKPPSAPVAVNLFSGGAVDLSSRQIKTPISKMQPGSSTTSSVNPFANLNPTTSAQSLVFGTPKPVSFGSAANANATNSTGFTFGSAGAAANGTKASFSFGQHTNSSTSSMPSISFGTSQKPPDTSNLFKIKSTEEAVSSLKENSQVSAMTSFGNATPNPFKATASSSSGQEQARNGGLTFSFGSSKPETIATPSFKFGSTSSNAPVEKPKEEAQPAIKQSFAFGQSSKPKTEDTEPQVAVKQSFTFGQIANTAKSPESTATVKPFSFSSSSVDANSAKQPGIQFSFGTNANKEPPPSFSLGVAKDSAQTDSTTKLDVSKGSVFSINLNV
jgi:hypothetical protein